MTSLDLNLFRTLRALYEEGGATPVARRFGVTQAAISAQLAKLRQHYQDDLFVSNGRGMEPSVLMQRLIGPISEILELADAASVIKNDFDPLTHKRRFSVLAGTGYAITLLAQVNRRLHTCAPGIHITLSTFPTLNSRAIRMTELLNRHSCDFAITQDSIKSLSHPSLDLYLDDHVCLVDQNHPIAGSTISVDEYYELTHVVRQQDELSADHEIMALSDQPRKRKIGPVVRTNALVPFFLLGTDYVSTVPRRFALGTATRLPVRIIELPVKTPPLRISLQWSNHLEHDPGAVWFRNLVKEVASELPR